MQRQFVLHHHAGSERPVLFAILQHFFRRFKRIGTVTSFVASGEMRFINDKAAADGNVRLAINDRVVMRARMSASRFVRRQICLRCENAFRLIFREVDFVTSTGRSNRRPRAFRRRGIKPGIYPYPTVAGSYPPGP